MSFSSHVPPPQHQPIAQVYQYYQIMPLLQLHMRRVAAVAQHLATQLSFSLDVNTIVSACLLHDMGNIIKSDFTIMPEFLEPEGVAHWQLVKQQFMNHYGSHVNTATYRIARELGVGDTTLQLIKVIGVESMLDIAGSPNWAAKVCEYADMRVAPWGIVSIDERWQDLDARYASRYPTPQDRQRRAESQQLSLKIEKELFDHCSLQPEDLNDSTLAASITALNDFVVS